MANSRSNIYSVKLQGAELNLNKFDAEIKQYSGFNKNNSPFVGGCLSNLFTKTEENTTGSSDSVYVDDEGNVFTAELDGLYKNGEKVIDITAPNIYEGANPWTLEKIENGKEFDFYDVYIGTDGKTPDGFISAKYNKDTYLGAVELHFKNSVIDVMNTVSIQSEAISYNDEVIIDNIFYDWYYERPYNETPRCYVCIKTYFRNITTNTNYINITICNLKASIDVCRWDKALSNNVYYKYTPATFYAEENTGYVFLNIIDNTYNSILHFDLHSQNRHIYEVPVTFTLGESDGVTLWSNLISGGIFIRRYGANIYRNFKIYVLQASHTFSNATARKMVLEGRFNSIGGTIYEPAISLQINNDIDLSTQYLKYSQGTTVPVSLGTLNNSFVLRNYGVSYALRTNDNKNFWGICDYLTSSVTLRKDSNNMTHAMFEMGAVTGFVLVNNGYVSGICLPGGKILVTDWNNVDENSINIKSTVLGDGGEVPICCTFKDSEGNYYLLNNSEEVRPTIREINGCLVLNVNQLNNCYRLSDGKVLTFAPAWNNRASSNNLMTFTSAVNDNQKYLASAVNEYNLKDNASIVLNPIPVVTDALQVVQNNDYTFTVIANKNFYSSSEDYKVNFYSGDFTSSEFLYIGSTNYAAKTFVYNNQLDGLPFPIDTNGNVQLSPSLFCKTERFGNDVFIKEGDNAYQLMKDGAESVMSYYLGTLIENLEAIFILQGQYYAIINKQIFNVQFSGGVVQNLSFVVSVENLQFVGNSVYQAYFFSKTNRCLYTFSGANMLSQVQLVDKISEIYAYKYNQSTQSIILITDIGTLISSNLGMYLIEGFTPDDVFFYDKGVVFVSDSTLTYLQYYPDTDFIKHNIELETCFYGMNNETVTINDCLYLRLFSEEHEEGEVKVSATTISLRGRKTEETIFRFKASDWDKLTHSVYVRYQPKEQRGLGISFSINSPFKIASMSIGSKADAILIDKVSKGAINTPEITSNNVEW